MGPWHGHPLPGERSHEGRKSSGNLAGEHHGVPLGRARLPVDLSMLAGLATALVKVRAVPLAASRRFGWVLVENPEVFDYP